MIFTTRARRCAAAHVALQGEALNFFLAGFLRSPRPPRAACHPPAPAPATSSSAPDPASQAGQGCWWTLPACPVSCHNSSVMCGAAGASSTSRVSSAWWKVAVCQVSRRCRSLRMLTNSINAEIIVLKRKPSMRSLTWRIVWCSQRVSCSILAAQPSRWQNRSRHTGSRPGSGNAAPR